MTEIMCSKCWKKKSTGRKDLLCDNCRYIEKQERENLKRGQCKRCGEDKKVNRAEICYECHESLGKEDIINKPNHYHGGGIDPIGLGEKIFTEEEMIGFYKMNILKYRMRAGKKEDNSEEQDLLKADFYEKKLKEKYYARIHNRGK